jgi:5-methylcytosine-specific restriction endonuclease McrA
MRPVKKPRDQPPYSISTTFSFSGAGASAVAKVAGFTSTNNVPIQDCLDAWLRQVKGQKPLAGTRADQARAVAAIQNHVGKTYKLASIPLIRELGAFCSFCETPLPGLAEVEHCVPKSEYPLFALLWENFLISCSPCNSSKGNVPSRSLVRNWISKGAPGEQDYYNEIRNNHYVWADLHSKSYRWLPLCMEYYDTVSGSWNVLPVKDAANLDNQQLSSDPSTRKVRARIYDPEDATMRTHKDHSVRVVFCATCTRAREMISLCKLNEHGNLASSYDRRVMNRTIVWFRALNTLKNYSSGKDSNIESNLWKMFLGAAELAGFYSVWMTILLAHDPALGKRFLQDSNANEYYPNTEPKDLP